MKQAHQNNLLRSISLLGTLLLLTGCGAAGAAAPATEPAVVVEPAVVEDTGAVAEEAVTEEADLERMPGIANPWKDTDAAEIAEMTGTEVPVPAGAENVTYRILLGEDIAEVAYDLDGVHYNHRLKKTDVVEDISGLHYLWDTTEEGTYEGHPATISRVETEEETVELTLWLDEAAGLMHALSSITV